MKWYLLALWPAVFSTTLRAQQADPCAALVGSALEQCQVNQQKLQRQQLALQQQQLTEQQRQLERQQQQLAQQQQQLMQQQQQLAQQQQQLQQQQERQSRLNEQNQLQLEDMRHQSEILTKQLEHGKSANQPPPAAMQHADLEKWKAQNPWFGSDYAKTQFAIRYAQQLQQERPDLVGLPLLDAISAKVRDKFGASK
jgi:chromosome segregation ATPase